MAEQAEILQELQRRGKAGELNERQQEILGELQRRLGPGTQPTSQRPLRVGEPQPASDVIDPSMLQAAQQPLSQQIYAPTNEGNYVLQDRPQPQQVEPGVEETFTKPSELVPLLMTGPAMALGARAGTRLASELTNPILKTAAPYVGAAAGSEAANMTGKAMSGQDLTPDLSDALAMGVPLAAGAWPTAKAVTGQYALKTQTGKQVVLEDAQRLTQASNAKLTADFEAAQAADEAQRAVQQRVFGQQMNAHQALLDFQKAEKERYATQLRQFVNATREGDHVRAQQLAGTLPGVPTEQAVKEAYADVTMLAKQNAIAIQMPEVAALRKDFLTEGERLSANIGQTPLTRRMTAIGNAGQGEQDLLGIWEFKKQLRSMMSDLAGVDTSAARGQRRLYGRMLDAIDTDLEGLAKAHPDIDQWQALVTGANQANLKHETVKELQGFLTSNLLDINPATGEGMFNAGKFLRAIEQDSNAQLKNYMQKTTFPELENKSLYDITQENFKQYVKDVHGGTESLRELRRTGGVPVPEKPAAPAIYPEMPPKPTLEPAPTGNTRPDRGAVVGDALTRLALAGTAGYLYSQGASYPAVGIALGAAAGLPQLISHFFLSDAGQKTLLKIMTEYGGKMTPEAIGFLTAATRASGLTAPSSPPR